MTNKFCISLIDVIDRYATIILTQLLELILIGLGSVITRVCSSKMLIMCSSFKDQSFKYNTMT